MAWLLTQQQGHRPFLLAPTPTHFSLCGICSLASVVPDYQLWARALPWVPVRRGQWGLCVLLRNL